MLTFRSDTPEDEDRPREPLFVIDGVTYAIPERFHPVEMARYAHMVEQFGGDQAAVWALRYAVGDEGYLKFINLPTKAVSTEDFARVMGVVTGRLVGLDVLVPEGKGSGGVDSGGTSASPESTSTTPAADESPTEPDAGAWPHTEPDSSPDDTPTSRAG